jgi:hypothetical protein
LTSVAHNYNLGVDAVVVVSGPEIRVRAWILGHHLKGNGSLEEEEEEEVNRAEPRWTETASRILNGLGRRRSGAIAFYGRREPDQN